MNKHVLLTALIVGLIVGPIGANPGAPGSPAPAARTPALAPESPAPAVRTPAPAPRPPAPAPRPPAPAPRPPAPAPRPPAPAPRPPAPVLKYTVHLESHPSSVPAPAAVSPMLAVLGPMVINMIAPPGGLDTIITVGEQGMRVDYPQAYLMIPAGGAILSKRDGTNIVIDTVARTYWKMAGFSAASVAAAFNPRVEVKRTGQFATTAGLQTERATLTIRASLPIAAAGSMPGLPSELVVTGEAWLSDRYKEYSALTSGLVGGAGALGLTSTTVNGFLVRALLRGELFGSQEIESTVTSLSEVDVPASTFEVPAGFTEVQPPATGALTLPGAR